MKKPNELGKETSINDDSYAWKAFEEICLEAIVCNSDFDDIKSIEIAGQLELLQASPEVVEFSCPVEVTTTENITWAFAYNVGLEARGVTFYGHEPWDDDN